MTARGQRHKTLPNGLLRESTLVVGRPGVCKPNRPLRLDAGLLEGDVAKAGGDRCEGEAGRPPLHWPAWLGACRRGSNDRELSMGIVLFIRRMLLVVRIWDDFVGADEVELSVAVDCGVLGEDCEAMDVILAQEFMDEGWGCRKGLECQRGRGLPA